MLLSLDNPPRACSGRGTAQRSCVVEGLPAEGEPLHRPAGGRPPLQLQGRTGEEGFSLVELMVVIVILGLLATIVIINVMPAVDRAANTKARADIATLEQAIEMYRLDRLAYPPAAEGLQALLAGQYIRRLPNDPWGHPYRYSVPGPGGRPYRIVSWGADGREGGSGDDADIAN